MCLRLSMPFETSENTTDCFWNMPSLVVLIMQQKDGVSTVATLPPKVVVCDNLCDF